MSGSGIKIGKGPAKAGGKPGGRYDSALLDRIREAVNIVEIVGEHVVLRKSGANHGGLCPFHNERSPSFSVNELKGVYHCHGCKAGGDVFTFVREIYGLSFPEVVRELADRAGVKIPDGAFGTTSSDPETAKRQAEARERRATAYKLNRYAAAFFRQTLVESPAALAYLRSRGVTEELERNFYVGLAPASWDSLTRKLITAKAPLDIAVKLGLIRPSTKAPKPGSPGYFDLFRGRLMFPIVDLRGKVAGFGGRILPPDVVGDSQATSSGEPGPKYMNSPESPLFQKGKLLYGLHPARKHIREHDEVILVEGFFDVLALHAAGFENAVATCGTALTPDHLTLLKRFATKITVLFDSDNAGIAATERAMELGLEQGVVVHGASITGGKDPGDLIQQPDGKERLKEILSRTAPLLDSSIEREMAGATDSENRSQALKKIGGWLSSFQDPVGRAVRVDNLKSRHHVSEALLASVLPGASVASVAKNRAPVSVQAGPPVPPMPEYGDFGDFGGMPPMPDPGGAWSPGSDARGGGRGQGGYGKQGRRSGGDGRGRDGRGYRDRERPQGLVELGPPPAQPPAGASLHGSERRVLTALVRWREFAAGLDRIGRSLPPGSRWGDLFEYPPAKFFTDEALFEPLSGQPAGGSGGENGPWKASPEQFTAGIRDVQVRSTITEALVSDEAPFTDQDLRSAGDRLLYRTWARFSQKLEADLAAAEARNDAVLEEKLKKEFLDVKRKMMEFNNFYEEA